MKRILAYTLTALLLCTTLCLGVFADEPITVYVTIADDNGVLVLAHEAITVTTDFDFDGTLSIADAIFCAHEAKFEGGADAGFACERTVYGLSLIKLWGIDNGGSFGYYCNNASPMSLSDAIANRDLDMIFNVFANDPLVTCSMDDAKALFREMVLATKDYLTSYDLSNL